MFKKSKNFLDKRTKTVEIIEREGKKLVKKTYLDTVNLQNEIAVLKRMSYTGYSPKIIEEGNEYIITEFIEGELLSDRFKKLVCNDDVAGLEKLADMLSIFLQIFYSCCNQYTIYDIEFTNFMIKDDRCYGLDYEDCKEGMSYRDIAGIVAFALCETVSDVGAVVPFVEKLLDNFHLDIMDIINEVKEYLTVIKQDRIKILDVEEMLACLLHVLDVA